MTSAFISYSRHDRPVADFIGAHLRNRGVDVFIDYRRLKSGTFVEQLGVKIEEQEYFLVVVSPKAVQESKWVKAEVTWAFSEKDPKYIIPILYRPAKMTSVFVLASLERVDFTRWDSDRQMDDDIIKLCRLMNIQLETDVTKPVAEPMLGVGTLTTLTQEEKVVAETEATPTFARGDVAKLFQSAAEVQETDPERALFLYQQVLEIDPDFMGGRIRDFVKRQERALKPARLALLQERITSARQLGDWTDVIQLADTMLDIDPGNDFALEQSDIAKQNEECEPVYEQAKIAHANDNPAGVLTLLQDIENTCPEFGDPAQLLAGQQITRDTVGYLQVSHKLAAHTGPVQCVAFSPDGTLLATASTDNTVRIWTVADGLCHKVLAPHEDWVDSVAFSADGRFFVSASVDGYIQLFATEGWELQRTKSIIGRLCQASFSADVEYLYVADGNGRLTVYELPELKKMPAPDNYGRRSRPSRISCDSRLFAEALFHHSELSEVISIYVKNLVTSRSYKLCEDVRDHESVTGIELSMDGRYLATYGRSLQIRELPKGHILDTVGNYQRLTDAVFSPQQSSFLTYATESSGGGTLSFFCLASKSVTRSIVAHDRTINSIAFSSDGRLIATGSDDCTAKVWQL